MVVITHSGFARSVLLAVQREPYRPQNAELIPVLVEQTHKRGVGDEEDDSWIDAVLDQHASLLQEEDKGAGEHQQEQEQPCPVRRFISWAMQRLHAAARGQ